MSVSNLNTQSKDQSVFSSVKKTISLKMITEKLWLKPRGETQFHCTIQGFINGSLTL